MASRFNLGSVAFLDLLTCGLGGALLLFFIVVAVRNTNSSQDREDAAIRGQSSEIVFLQLSVAAESNLAPDSERRYYFEMNGLEVEAPENVEVSSGKSFLIVYATGEMPAGLRLMVTGLNSEQPIQGIVSDRFGTRDLKVSDPSKSFCLYQFVSRSQAKTE